jgi:hypothetical protein
MRRTVLACCILLLSLKVYSQKGDVGLGVNLGNPTGISAKYWTGERTAVAASIGYYISRINHLRLNADFLVHPWTFDSEQDLVRLYLGTGFGLGFTSEISVTLRFPLGAVYFFSGLPLEVFAEPVPAVQLAGPGGVKFWPEGYLGIRWYF